jgi:hypothetical protein
MSFRVFVALALLLLYSAPSIAQSSQAAVAQITSGDVEIMRADTTEWIRVSNGAVMPIGAGDRLRTDETGRVFLTFDEALSIVLLPDSTLTLNAYAQRADEISISAALTGALVQREAIAAPTLTYALALSRLDITDAPPHFAVWSDPMGGDAVAVDEGTMQLERDETAIFIEAGYAYWTNAPVDAPFALDAPMSMARIMSHFEACRGTINNRVVQPPVHDGAGTGWALKARLEAGIVLPLLIRTRSNYWTRVQYDSYFGWVPTDYIDSTCSDDLPIVADDAPEPYERRFFNAITAEVTILAPFYGFPTAQNWRYVQSD